ncbi:MAG TPA: AzlD domain-containing protein [Anaeromyxobacter sp.]
MRWLPALALAGLLTFATRLSFIVLLGRLEVPPIFVRALRFVPPAVLSAIIATEVLVRDGRPDLSLGNLRLVVSVIAALVAWRTRNVFLTIGVGMASLWVAQAVL